MIAAGYTYFLLLAKLLKFPAHGELFLLRYCFDPTRDDWRTGDLEWRQRCAPVTSQDKYIIEENSGTMSS